MLIRGKKNGERKSFVAQAAFTLFEMLISIVLFAMVMSGVIYGYVETNNYAEWSSMSLAAQSYAIQGLESVRGAQWDMSQNPALDELNVPASGYTNFIQHDVMAVPVSGAPLPVTNYITLQTVTNVNSSSLRYISSSCIWVFPLTGKVFTNTVATYRAPDYQ